MNKAKTTTVSTNNNQQNRSSNSSVTQNSPVPPKPTTSTKPVNTTSNYFNNNIMDPNAKGSTGNGVERPSSAGSQKGRSTSSNTGQQQKRPTTPTQGKNASSGANASFTSQPFQQKQASTSSGASNVVLQPPISQKQQQINSQASSQPLQKQPPTTTGQSTQQSPEPVQHSTVINPAAVQQKQGTQQPQQNNIVGPKTTTFTGLPPTSSNTSIKSNSSARSKAIGANQQQKQAQISGSTVANNNIGSNVKQQDAKTGGNTAIVATRQSTRTFPVPVSHNRYPSNVSRSMVSLERSRNFRAFIEKAMNDHKIFACCGVYPAVRNALKKRGWVEKPGPLAYSRSANGAISQNKEDESDVAWMTRVLKEYPPDFIWVIRRDNIDWKNLTKEQMINRFPKAWFTTKVGLAACLQHMHWFSEAGVADTFFPRCYRLCLEEERQAFQDDYRLTACMSYLRYFVDTFEAKGHQALADVHSKITPLSVDFASRQLGNYIRMRRHEDIDWLLPPNFMTQHWDAFIHQYYAVVHEKKRLRFDSQEAVHMKYETAKKTLAKVVPYWPQIQLDGVYNMWICKPGARSRGKGIVIMNTLEKIMDLMSQNNFRELNWVVQKYIEKPMLIYKTKFDIRQWFLITDWTPLTVWFYKESYVRFCTKPFVLEDFHESIHLCNNAIQCRYQNAEQRDSNLPDENMWSSDTFQAYLKTIGRLDAWPIIYSGMKQAIVGVLLASQETVESKKGCYELYGADFMLTEDFRPWLIEINSCPCMAASTSVTARMCTQCLEDTIKVVVDRKLNRNTDTGMFEMIYRQNAGSVVVQQFSGHDLTIVGKKLTRDIDWPMTMSKSATNTNPKKVSQNGSTMLSQTQSNNNKDSLTFSDLLQKLRVRNQQMFQGALATQQAHTAEVVVAEAASANTDSAGVLLNKMRSLRIQPQEQDLISGMKKVYPTPDPKQITPKKNGNNGGSASPTEKNALLLTEATTRTPPPGRGEDPTVSTKFADVNSLAYLMRNTHNTSTTIGDLVRISKEAANDAISRTKRHDDKRQEESLLNKPVPKTLEEVKALVESTSRQNSEKYGKIQNETHITFLSDILHNNSCDESNMGKVNLEKLSTSNKSLSTITSSTFGLSNKEPTADSGGNNNSEGLAAIRSSGCKDQIRQSLPGSSLTRSLDSSSNVNIQIENEDTAISDNVIRRTKSLSLNSQTLLSESNSTLSKYLHSQTAINQRYMFYPTPAHPSHEDVPCDINEKTVSCQCVASPVDVEDEFLDINNLVDSLIHEVEHTGKEEATTHEYTDNNLNNEMNSQSDLTQSELVDLPLIDLVCSDSKIQEQLQRASKSQSNTFSDDDIHGKLFKSILPSSSDSDSDLNDDNNNEINLATHFIPSTCTYRHHQPIALNPNKNGRHVSKPKPHPPRFYQRRNTIPSSRRCSRRYPCYRVVLEPQNHSVAKKKAGPTLPMKTINLLLPKNCNFY